MCPVFFSCRIPDVVCKGPEKGNQGFCSRSEHLLLWLKNMGAVAVQKEVELKVSGTHLNAAPPASTVDIATPIESSTLQAKTSCACGGGCPDCQSKLPLQAKAGNSLSSQISRSTTTIQRISCSGGSGAAPRQVPQKNRNPRDARANAIIRTAQDTTRPISERAIATVRLIICQYYRSDAGLVHDVRYRAGEPGLLTTSRGRRSSATGIISVGNYFVNNTTNRRINRRVLQVGHEIRHIHQYRSGLSGHGNKDEREFLAFTWEALADEFAGTGRMSRSTRVSLIDAALGYYNCLAAALKRRYRSQQQRLLSRRRSLISTGRVRRAGSLPTSCSRP